MESRLAEKIGSLEASVAGNKGTIVQLTGALNKNTVDLARLETRITEVDSGLETRVTDIVRSVISRDQSRISAVGASEDNQGSRQVSSAQMDRYDRCRRSLRI